MRFLASLTPADLSVIGALITAVTGAFYAFSRFTGDRKTGRVEEDRFYKEVYDDLNKTLWTQVQEDRIEIKRLEAIIQKLRERIGE